MKFFRFIVIVVVVVVVVAVKELIKILSHSIIVLQCNFNYLTGKLFIFAKATTITKRHQKFQQKMILRFKAVSYSIKKKSD